MLKGSNCHPRIPHSLKTLQKWRWYWEFPGSHWLGLHAVTAGAWVQSVVKELRSRKEDDKKMFSYKKKKKTEYLSPRLFVINKVSLKGQTALGRRGKWKGKGNMEIPVKNKGEGGYVDKSKLILIGKKLCLVSFKIHGSNRIKKWVNATKIS